MVGKFALDDSAPAVNQRGDYAPLTPASSATGEAESGAVVIPRLVVSPVRPEVTGPKPQPPEEREDPVGPPDPGRPRGS